MQIRIILFFTCLLSGFHLSFGQDLGNLGKQEPFTVRGGLGLHTQFSSTDPSTYYPNFGWALQGNLTFSLYGFQVPLSVSIRNDSRSLRHPFNRIGLSPSYKWVKVHIGHRSMHFSPYIYSGHTFLGGGVELTPGKFRLSAFAGKLQSNYPVIDDVAAVGSYPTYDRNAFGAKIGYGSDQSFIDLIVFRAKDKLNEPEFPDSLARFIRPENNLSVGVSGSVRMFKVLRFHTNVAASAFSYDTRASTRGIQEDDLEAAEPFLDINRTSRMAFAGDAAIQIDLGRTSFGVEYKRVNPLYRSLGVYYLQNDFEEITFKANVNAIQSKLNLRGKVGIRNDNLQNYKTYTQKRNIYSVDLTVKPVEALLVTARYSNIDSDRQPGFIELEDTLRYAQTTSQFQVMPQVTWKTETVSHTITLNYLNQGLDEVGDFLAEPRNTKTSFARGSYSVNLKDEDLRVTFGIHQNEIEFPGRISSRTGINASVRKQLFDKLLSANARISFSKAKLNKEKNGNVVHLSSGARLNLLKKHSLSLNIRYLQKQNQDSEVTSDVRGSASYAFTF